LLGHNSTFNTEASPSMPAWLIPALKAALPHVATIISAAAPVFTRKSADAAANQALLLQQQITELQSAASQNAAHIKELAAELQRTLSALEQAASIAETRLRRVLFLCIASAIVSVVALGIVLVVVFGG
jgi:uncharacterized protein YlxW (UPF0749 family)